MNDGNTPASSKVSYIVVSFSDAGQRIDNFLFRLLKKTPKSHIYRIIRGGEIRINKGRVKPTYRIIEGDRIRIPPLRICQEPVSVERLSDSVLARIQDSIIYENGDLIFIDKPAGMAVHGGTALDYGLIESMRQVRLQKPALQLVHRLDRATSGCLMIAKSRRMLNEVHKLMREGKVEKHYLALIAGRWQGGKRSVTASISRHKGRSYHKVRVGGNGRQSESIFKPLRRFRNSTLVDVEIRTGRTHQIRAHAAHIGYPVAGDDKYGNFDFNRTMRKIGLKRLFLHASRLVFKVPVTGKRYSVIAPLDPALTAVLHKLEQA
jgi:23S rRNA pseudouridine955/2504/2580 synthase